MSNLSAIEGIKCYAMYKVIGEAEGDAGWGIASVTPFTNGHLHWIQQHFECFCEFFLQYLIRRFPMRFFAVKFADMKQTFPTEWSVYERKRTRRRGSYRETIAEYGKKILELTFSEISLASAYRLPLFPPLTLPTTLSSPYQRSFMIYVS